MKRSLHRYHFLAAAPSQASTSTNAMSSRPSYRRGRNQPRRSFSDRPYTGARGHNFSGGGGADWQFRPVQDADSGFRHGESGRSFENNSVSHHSSPILERPPQNQRFRPPPPPHIQQNQQFRPSPQFRRPPPQNRPRPPDYRNWEFAKSAPPSTSERFTILSYNLLAEYVALDYRHRNELYYHIPRHMLEWQWRKSNIIFELGLWSTDIMCFQEVDRFQDLEEELKLRGYNGIWKRRTGKAIDGCAIFWRVSRFKLLHEESIEFNKFGLRENVAQICVLELMRQNCDVSAAALPTSSTGSNKVVVCNIHVLYNPKRGEIKLGQVRILLLRAHAVSKIWNDAPIVLCGDYNCVPKSPVYNFISEQKLDLSELHRDKVSGQSSAEIRSQRTYNSFSRFRSGDNLGPAPSAVQHSEDSITQNESSFDTQKPYNVDGNLENVPLVENFFQPRSNNALDVCDGSSTEVNHAKGDEEAKEETQQSSVEDPSDRSGSTCCVPGVGLGQDIITPKVEGGTSTGHFDGETVSSHPKEVYSDVMEMGSKEKMDNSDVRLFSSNSDPKKFLDEESMNCSSEQISSDEQAGFSGPSQAHWPTASTNTEVQEKLANSILNDSNEAIAEERNLVEDSSTFLSALHDTQDDFSCDPGQLLRSGLPESDPSKGFASALNNSSQGVENDLSPCLDPQSLVIEKSFYDPSSWTPRDIETATGNADCTFLEHPLKLRSTYTEVEDTLGIRDSNGEPLVTSYNRCFLGTVDYIWRSEGLQTVKVLAPIPKHVMQTTAGFPTKKWGSDHIALASELAFVKDDDTKS
ncbi:hypothetical protein TIFTF001_014391 [Ficus carica]|uniref:Endonuclease/exonuclease/phosphatase domain-containing protein n=1 Tax=Ficus carica TaxID=3494 RepID=A0AA88A2N2_FICCA|nr:hypothetical protein TIFTF001_014391 [Ficus carica]